MGLKILVRTHQGHNHIDRNFGSGSPQIIIDDFGECPNSLDVPPVITLLQTSDREKLFEIRPDLDEREMEGDLKRPLKGYGKFLLRWNIRDDKDHSNVLRLFETLATSMAIMISKDLYKESRANTQHAHGSGDDALSAMSISDGQIEDQQSSSEEEVDDDDDNDSQQCEDSGGLAKDYWIAHSKSHISIRNEHLQSKNATRRRDQIPA
ncbi:hypothetical protein AYO20_05801 [Fonsecaea nubica]|uniref:Uncharacterized protein n=1 Tax=Fonsecaea nubica TaxID=856822 RepID=A0A178D0V8_9EURO|nr:hypothetical protein AYO20_05801 [Fonsecaea nubica]OAL34841.1 hypothetical protein AYO20_05801 [Fonsecaea nubica]